MKKTVVIILLMFAVNVLFSQVRNLQGMNAFALRGGLSGIGYNVTLGYEHIFYQNWLFKGELMAEKLLYKKISAQTFNVFIGTDYTLFNIKDAVFFKLGLGGQVLIGSINDADKLDSSKGGVGLNYGGYGELDIDAFIFRNLILNGNFKQSYLLGDSFGKTAYYVSIGLKYQF